MNGLMDASRAASLVGRLVASLEQVLAEQLDSHDADERAGLKEAGSLAALRGVLLDVL